MKWNLFLVIFGKYSYVVNSTIIPEEEFTLKQELDIKVRVTNSQ